MPSFHVDEGTERSRLFNVVETKENIDLCVGFANDQVRFGLPRRDHRRSLAKSFPGKHGAGQETDGRVSPLADQPEQRLLNTAGLQPLPFIPWLGYSDSHV